MGWLSIALGLIASWLFHRTDSAVLMWITIIATAASFLSYGVMHNHAVESAKQRPAYKGDFFDFTERDLMAVSNSVTQVNMFATIALAGLMVTALVFTF